MFHAAQSPARYALGQYVFVCVSGQDLVLLDLARDKYLAVDAAHAAGLSTVVPGWPVLSRESSRAAAPDESGRILEGLLQRGLLTKDPTTGKDATPVELPAPADEISTDIPGERLRAGITEAGAFIVASVTGRFLRKHRPIEQVVTRARLRKERALSAGAEFDVEKVRRLMKLSVAMRSVFLSTRDRCLLESVVLLEFLAHYRAFPTWVFGVQTRPFAAHCWLQHGDLVLNDTVDHVTRYTPIMAV